VKALLSKKLKLSHERKIINGSKAERGLIFKGIRNEKSGG
jgi:hypothetical protein